MTKQKLKPQYSELITTTEVQLLHTEYGSLYPTAAQVAEKILGITDHYRVNEMISKWAAKYKITLEKVPNKNTYYVIGYK